MKIDLVRTLVALAWTGAGCCLYLALANRHLIVIPDGRMKNPIILIAGLVLVGGMAGAGILLPIAPWVYLPAAVLLLAAVGEWRRLVLRRVYAGSPPVDTLPHRIDYRRPFTTTDLVTHRYVIALPDWHGPEFRIAHLSDLHVNRRIPASYYREVLDTTEKTNPDLVFITGDFVTKRRDAPLLNGLLRPIGRLGTYAVLGNHDYWAGAEYVRGLVRNAGITLLTTDSVERTLDGGTIEIAGTEYPWGDRTCRLPPARADTVRLVLSHTPDNIYKLSRQKAHAVFSGHFHAGQFRVPGLGSIVVPSAYGRRFDHGHFFVHGTHLFVASGIGVASPPLRVYCQPDIFVVDVKGRLPG